MFSDVKYGVEYCNGSEILLYHNQYAKDGKMVIE
jgi:hypothetical protein